MGNDQLLKIEQIENDLRQASEDVTSFTIDDVNLFKKTCDEAFKSIQGSLCSLAQKLRKMHGKSFAEGLIGAEMHVFEEKMCGEFLALVETLSNEIVEDRKKFHLWNVIVTKVDEEPRYRKKDFVVRIYLMSPSKDDSDIQYVISTHKPLLLALRSFSNFLPKEVARCINETLEFKSLEGKKNTLGSEVFQYLKNLKSDWKAEPKVCGLEKSKDKMNSEGRKTLIEILIDTYASVPDQLDILMDLVLKDGHASVPQANIRVRVNNLINQAQAEGKQSQLLKEFLELFPDNDKENGALTIIKQLRGAKIMDPGSVSIAATLGVKFLEKGADFIWNEASKILDRYRKKKGDEKKLAKRGEVLDIKNYKEIKGDLPDIIRGDLKRVINFENLELHEIKVTDLIENIKEHFRVLGKYEKALIRASIRERSQIEIDIEDQKKGLLQKSIQLKDILEKIYGEKITIEEF